MLYNFLNPIKQAKLASVSSRQGPSKSQISFTAWLHLEISKPSTSSSHLRLLLAQEGQARAKHKSGLTLASTTQETPGPAHPVDSYRPLQSTVTLSLHSWSSLEGRSCWSVVTANPCSWLAWLNPSYWTSNSNQGSTIRGGGIQPTWRVHLEYPAWVKGEAVPLDLTGHLLH